MREFLVLVGSFFSRLGFWGDILFISLAVVLNVLLFTLGQALNKWARHSLPVGVYTGLMVLSFIVITCGIGFIAGRTIKIGPLLLP